ncbi:MAG TPA: Rid family hydrolase [Stellaceae bacterium]|jgi:enamine deaminase RidA (YjgF/YER057c/UK114 family)|nr:Rid family hydrolase [Stellaceae bacterium]
MAKRQSVNFPGFAHGNPIPNASRIGNIMMSSVISGVDPGTRNLPPDLAGQAANLFIHIRSAVEAAGGTVDDILKINFWMKEPGTGRAALNGEWVRMFPEEASRPARHTLALGGDGNALVHLRLRRGVRLASGLVRRGLVRWASDHFPAATGANACT